MARTFGPEYERRVSDSERFGAGRDTKCPTCGLVLPIITLCSSGCPECNKKRIAREKGEKIE